MESGNNQTSKKKKTCVFKASIITLGGQDSALDCSISSMLTSTYFIIFYVRLLLFILLLVFRRRYMMFGWSYLSVILNIMSYYHNITSRHYPSPFSWLIYYVSAFLKTIHLWQEDALGTITFVMKAATAADGIYWDTSKWGSVKKLL